jgi:hypothetical protein
MGERLLKSAAGDILSRFSSFSSDYLLPCYVTHGKNELYWHYGTPVVSHGYNRKRCPKIEILLITIHHSIFFCPQGERGPAYGGMDWCTWRARSAPLDYPLRRQHLTDSNVGSGRSLAPRESPHFPLRRALERSMFQRRHRRPQRRR